MTRCRMLCRVFIPLHVTGLWLPVRHSSPLLTGSMGAGLLLEPPATATVYECDGGEAGFRGRAGGTPLPKNLDVVERVYGVLGGARALVEFDSPVPLGAGYAVSAAAALAAALAEACIVEGLTVEEACRAAHRAEVEAGTGLGDVVAMLYGRGLEVRYSPGGPGIARVESVPVTGSYVVYSLATGEMATSTMHSTLGDRLYTIAAPLLSRIMARPSLHGFLEAARRFSLEAGFAPPDTAGILDSMVSRGLLVGWYAKKKVVLAVAPRKAEDDAGRELERLARERGWRLYRHRLAFRPLWLEPVA